MCYQSLLVKYLLFIVYCKKSGLLLCGLSNYMHDD